MIDIMIKGNLRIEVSDQSTGTNSPGTVSISDDEYTALWMDPDGAIAETFARNPQGARALFLDNKRRTLTQRKKRKGK